MEILHILERCNLCGTATALLVQHTYMSMNGAMHDVIERDEPRHTRSDCKNFITLQREQWPTLW